MPGNEQISSLAALGAEGAAPPDPPKGRSGWGSPRSRTRADD